MTTRTLSHSFDPNTPPPPPPSRIIATVLLMALVIVIGFQCPSVHGETDFEVRAGSEDASFVGVSWSTPIGGMDEIASDVKDALERELYAAVRWWHDMTHNEVYVMEPVQLYNVPGEQYAQNTGDGGTFPDVNATIDARTIQEPAGVGGTLANIGGFLVDNAVPIGLTAGTIFLVGEEANVWDLTRQIGGNTTGGGEAAQEAPAPTPPQGISTGDGSPVISGNTGPVTVNINTTPAAPEE